MGEVLREAGYSETVAKTPSKVTNTKSWKQLMDKYIPEEKLAEKHLQLLEATGIGHMVFPMAITDEEITELLAGVNCVPKKIQHGDTANHVWFWQRDNNALKNGLDMAYKLRGSYAADKLAPPPSQIIINVLGNPEAKKLSEQMDKVLIKNIYEGEIINNASQDSGQTREQSREPELSEPIK